MLRWPAEGRSSERARLDPPREEAECACALIARASARACCEWTLLIESGLA